MDESVAYSATHQSVVKQTLAKGLSLPMAVAEKQILATNFSTTFNTASIDADRERHEGSSASSPPTPAPSSLIWNP